MKQKCLFAYGAIGSAGLEIGNGYCYFKCYPPTMKDIRETEKKLCEKLGVSKVTILNFLPLSEDREDN